jgi:glycosyltransferase involved in cell wall biosynthesis
MAPGLSTEAGGRETRQMNLALLLSCGSFEGFFGWIQRQTRESYLASYRSDWSWYYARALREHGITPTIYIPSLHEAGRYETDAGIAVRFLPISAWERPLENNLLRRVGRLNPLSLYVQERLNTIAFLPSLRAGLVEDKIDLLYVQEYWSGRFDHLTETLDLPLVAADHGGLSQGVVKTFKRQAFAKAALCYVQTDDERRIVERYGGKAQLAPNGCNTSDFFPDPTIERTKTLLTVARLSNRQKRTSDLIRALAKLPEEWSLDIAGTGPAEAMLRRLAHRLGVSDRVRFLGFVSRDQVRTLLRTCGVYAMPSANEAIALAVLEAMACGASVVLSKIRALEQIVTDGVDGRLTPVGDVNAIVEAIKDAWVQREAFGRAARRTVTERYDVDILYRDLATSLLRVVDEARGPSASKA